MSILSAVAPWTPLVALVVLLLGMALVGGWMSTIYVGKNHQIPLVFLVGAGAMGIVFLSTGILFCFSEGINPLTITNSAMFTILSMSLLVYTYLLSQGKIRIIPDYSIGKYRLANSDGDDLWWSDLAVVGTMATQYALMMLGIPTQVEAGCTVGPGTYTCTSCGYEHVQESKKDLRACPSCACEMYNCMSPSSKKISR